MKQILSPRVRNFKPGDLIVYPRGDDRKVDLVVSVCKAQFEGYFCLTLFSPGIGIRTYREINGNATVNLVFRE